MPTTRLLAIYFLILLSLFQYKVASASVEDGLNAYKNQDYASAFKIFKKYANKGESDAALYLGVMYDDGTGTRIDDGEALRWFKFAAENGNVIAPFEYGVYLESGIGVHRSPETAKIWYDHGVEKLEEIKKLAWEGNGFAQVTLSVLYKGSFQQDIENPELSYFWAERAVSQNHPQGFIHMAFRYLVGTGVKKDLELAKKYSYEGAMRGIASSKWALYMLCPSENEIYCEHADKLLIEAAEQGGMSAILEMGNNALKDASNKEDVQSAISWYLKVAEHGGLGGRAAYKLGNLYLDNEHVKDEKKSFEWFSVSSERGYKDSSMFLASMYYAGLGVEKDIDKSIEHLKISANEGVAFTQKKLGEHYESGEGVEKDLSIAKHWYEKAVENGSKDAKKPLMSMRWNFPEGDELTFGTAFNWVYFAPGDFALQVVDRVDGKDDFFGVDFESFGGWFAGVFSFFIWMFLLVGIISNE